MDGAELRAWCLAQNGAVEDFPFGPEHSVAIRPGYHLNKRHWNTITLDGSLPDQLVRELVEDFYDLVVSGLPKRTREQLGWALDADRPAPAERSG